MSSKMKLTISVPSSDYICVNFVSESMSNEYLPLEQFNRDLLEELLETELAKDKYTQEKQQSVSELYRRKHINNCSACQADAYRSSVHQSSNEHHRTSPQICHCKQFADQNCSYREEPIMYQEPEDATSKQLLDQSYQEERSPKKEIRNHQSKIPTVRTTRYIRASNMPKHPSTLCLPLNSQPDPAIHQRSKKANDKTTIIEKTIIEQEVCGDPKNDFSVTKKNFFVPSNTDVTSRLDELEDLLSKFEHGDPYDDTPSIHNDTCPIPKPRKHVKNIKKRKDKSNTPLEINRKQIIKELSNNIDTKPLSEQSCSDEKDFVKPEDRCLSKTFYPVQPSLDDISALELHKSKSYIVNLIDKALSKELGTIPSTRCEKNNLEFMTPSKTIKTMNRYYCDKSESNSSQRAVEHDCCHNVPISLKQLKQLRWNHIKHIQLETKRLVELEKFIDSFSEVDI